MGQTYTYSVEWQQATITGPSYQGQGGELAMKVDGSTKIFKSSGLNDSWQTASFTFVVKATTETVELGINGNNSVTGANGGIILVDSLSTAQVTPGNASDGLILEGTSSAETFVTADGDDIITAGGGADTILTGAGNDTVTVNGSTQTALAATNNTMLIDGGTGINQLINNSGGGSIDLTNPVISAKLRNFSSFDINGTANNTLKLGVNAVSTISGATDNAATTLVDESKMVVVNGSAGDVVRLVDKAAWSASAAQSGATLAATYGSAFKFVSGRSYVEYSRNGATLFVDSTVTVNTTTTSATAAVTTGQAVTVQTLFGPSFTDVDSGQTFKGVAITNAGSSTDVSGKGKYQISTNGTTWTDLAAGLTDATAIFAAPTALIRFVGAAGVEALAPQNLTVRLIDSSELTGTSGITDGTITTGDEIDASVNGGSTAFSGNTVTLQPSVNTAPVSTEADGVIDGDPLGPKFPAFNFSDFTGNGTFNFNGVEATVSGATGTVISAGSSTVFPAANGGFAIGEQNFTETVNINLSEPATSVRLDFFGYDVSATSAEKIVVLINGVQFVLKQSNLSNLVNAISGASATATLDASGALTGSSVTTLAGTITIDAASVPGGVINSVAVRNETVMGNPIGSRVKFTVINDGSLVPSKTVQELFGDVYSDANADAMQGVVITSAGATDTLGKYQWSSNNGTTWNDLAAGLTDNTSVYLAKTDLVRFVASSANTSSTAKQALTVRLVDDSLVSGSFASGATVNLSNTGTGGATAISGTTVTLGAVVAPVVLDLNRDGVIEYGNVLMDVNSDGVLDSTLWAGRKDGVLVWDKYHDGRVHDHTQYAFTEYGGSTDLEGLAAGFDTNRDGVFSMADEKFGEFKVWQDVDQDGVSDAGEVRSLADLGITSIDLTSDGVPRTPVAGVTEAGQSTAQLADGSSVLVADAAFEYRNASAAEAASHAVGQGDNVFKLFGGLSLDLSAVTDAAKLTEVNASADAAANTIKLTLADMLGAKGVEAVSGDMHQLVLTGDANDTALLSANEWLSTDTTVTQNDRTYSVYNAANDTTAQLLLDQQMAVTHNG